MHTFKIANLADLDQAFYLLNFDKIELGLSPDNIWSVFYVQACRFLDSRSRCSIHGQPERPHICREYNPYHCWYRPAFGAGADPLYLRIDRRRLEFLAGLLRFNESRDLVEFPSWEVLSKGIEEIPSVPNWKMLSERPSGADQKLNRDTSDVPEIGHSHPSSIDRKDFDLPCRECSAHCCKHLVFPKTIPENFSQLDYFRFCLGFPGVELSLSANAWHLIVRAKCRHLIADRCGVFGQPERPILCNYYDAWRCTFKPLFASGAPTDFIRIGLDEYSRVMELFQFDADGRLSAVPLLKTIRHHLDSSTLNSPTAVH